MFNILEKTKEFITAQKYQNLMFKITQWVDLSMCDKIVEKIKNEDSIASINLIYFINSFIRLIRLPNIRRNIEMKVLEIVLLVINSMPNKINKDSFHIISRIEFSPLVWIINNLCKASEIEVFLSTIIFPKNVIEKLFIIASLEIDQEIFDLSENITKFLTADTLKLTDEDIKNYIEKILLEKGISGIDKKIEKLSKYIDDLQNIILLIKDFLPMAKKQCVIPNDLMEKILKFELKIICVTKIIQKIKQSNRINIQITVRNNWNNLIYARLNTINSFIDCAIKNNLSIGDNLMKKIFDILLIEKKFSRSNTKFKIKSALNNISKNLSKYNNFQKVPYEITIEIWQLISNEQKPIEKSLSYPNFTLILNSMIDSNRGKTVLETKIDIAINAILNNKEAFSNAYCSDIIYNIEDLKNNNIKSVDRYVRGLFNKIIISQIWKLNWKVTFSSASNQKVKILTQYILKFENGMYILQNTDPDMSVKFVILEVNLEKLKKLEKELKNHEKELKDHEEQLKKINKEIKEINEEKKDLELQEDNSSNNLTMRRILERTINIIQNFLLSRGDFENLQKLENQMGNLKKNFDTVNFAKTEQELQDYYYNLFKKNQESTIADIEQEIRVCYDNFSKEIQNSISIGIEEGLNLFIQNCFKSKKLDIKPQEPSIKCCYIDKNDLRLETKHKLDNVTLEECSMEKILKLSERN